LTFSVAIAVCLAIWSPVHAQLGKPQLVTPNAEAVAAAYKLVEGVYAKFEAGKTEEIAKWLTEQVGYTWDAAKKVQNTSEYKAKLDSILLSPPQGNWGKLSGHDLIEESSLPGSGRYFRLTYITYHEGAPLVWEFRFYVKPDGKPSLNSFAWSDKNPFEYLSTADMQLLRWYGR
jgi:hypothetical protein